ncbi:MAG: S8 family serine peptidase [Acetobacter sp.]|nr:S8 family serine peptidase [Bacteroides sp.]MCM1341929.1 S8 family serine peptidase [Acetobacter sp.]MCM1434113.1 S8 family serine peptidase [Clostridiales bacterium]
MNKNKILSLILTIISVVCIVQPGLCVFAQEDTSEDKNYIVEVKNDKTYNKIKESFNDNVERNLEKIDDNNALLMSLNENEVLNIEKHFDVIIEEDVLVSADSVDNDMLDEFFAESNGETESTEAYTGNIKMVNGTEDDLGIYENTNVKIGILDSGISDNSELNVAEEICLIPDYREDNCGFYHDLSGHGTGIAGVIGAGKNGKGVIGICNGAELYSIQVLSSDNTAPISRIVNGINWAVENDINVLNISISTDVDSQILHNAIINAYNKGMTIVASAGNTAGKTQYPAKYDEVISVGSVDGQGNISSFSAHDEYVDIYAPGESVITTGMLNGYMAVDGTSIAAPHVTAAAARILAKDNTKNCQFVKELLKKSANTSYTYNDSAINFLDIKNAADIYEEFSNSASYDEIKPNIAEITEYEDDAVAVGCWSKNCHMDLIENNSSASLLQNRYIKIMMKSAYMADELYGVYYYKDKNNKNDANKIYMYQFYPLHAYGYADSKNKLVSYNSNFVADTKYLYRLARYYADSPSIEYAEKQENIDKVTKANANYSILQKIIFGGTMLTRPFVKFDDGRDIVDNVAVKGILHMNIDDDMNEGDLATRAYKILGLALHLAGDTYAHRTRVPLSSVDSGGCFNKNNGDFNVAKQHNYDSKKAELMNPYLKEKSKSNGNPCFCFVCFQGALKSGHVEFRDIKEFIIDENRRRSTDYKADSTDFYPKRYNIGTKNAVNVLISRFLNKQDFTIFVFLPSNTDYTLKLNCLTKYVKETGTNWDALQQSTRDRVEKLSTGALV